MKKVAFVAHCLANQNAKVTEFARCAGVVTPVVERLRAAGYEIEQLPCPELSFMGVNRWWQSKQQYDTTGYRRHNRELAVAVTDQIIGYRDHDYDVIIVGLDGSPTSGVRFTASVPTWGGRPESGPTDGEVVPGMGVWIEELKKEIESRGLPFPHATGVLLDSPDWDLDKSVEDLNGFLEEVSAGEGK